MCLEFGPRTMVQGSGKVAGYWSVLRGPRAAKLGALSQAEVSFGKVVVK